MRVVCAYNSLGVGNFIELLSAVIVLPIIYTYLQKEWLSISVIIFSNSSKIYVL